MTFSDSIDFIHKAKKEDIKLFSFYAIIFLIIYGAMITKFGYNHDELTMMTSQSYAAGFRASGRWFFALWKWLIGAIPTPFTYGCAATIFISLSLVILTKSIHFSTIYSKAVFGVIYLIQFQFAYVMEYSYQVDVVALGMVFLAYASWEIQKEGALSLSISTLLLMLSLAIYQSLILNFCIVILVLLYNHLYASDIKAFHKLFLRFIICCICALALYFLTSKLSIILISTPPAVIEAIKDYQSQFNIAGQIGIDNINGLIFQFIYTVYEYAKTLIFPNAYEGEWIYTFAILPLLILFIHTFKQKRSILQKIQISLILIGIWIMPFFLNLIFLNPNAMWAHNRLGEPLALACLWHLAIPIIRWSRVKSILFIIILAIMTLKSSYYVGKIANARRQSFEAQLLAYKEMEFEAAKKAAEANIPLDRDNILLYRFKSNNSYHEYDTMLNYPALSYTNPSRRVCQQLLPEYEEVLKEMPFWPKDGSIVVYNNKVLVKFDSTCFHKK